MLWVAIDRTQTTPLIKQIYDQIRLSIVRGDLRAGEQLPSTRQLARDLHVSRIVVVEVYDQLLAEGYIESRPGSGTYIAEGVYLEGVQGERFVSAHTTTDDKRQSRDIIDFRSGVPALDCFPRRLWGQLGSQLCAELSALAFGYGPPEGCAELRRALTRYLAKARGVRCHPDQIMITSGAAQAFSLLARLLSASFQYPQTDRHPTTSPGRAHLEDCTGEHRNGQGFLHYGDEVIIEDPVTYEVPHIFSSAGLALHPIPVDENGMHTDLLPSEGRRAFVFVTPSHQFPLGGILSIQRRIQLIQFARATGCYIVEDDYDSEFRYTGTPVSSLQELAPERVIYIGTLSKCLSPALRLGYMVLPEPLIEPCRRLKRLSDIHTPALEQFTLARFIDEGYLERHIMKMKKIYRRRREALIAALMKHFPHDVHISGDATGLHLIAELRGRTFTDETLAELENAGVRFYPVEQHAIRKGCHQSKAILGYGNLSQDEIEEGVRRAKSVL